MLSYYLSGAVEQTSNTSQQVLLTQQRDNSLSVAVEAATGVSNAAESVTSAASDQQQLVTEDEVNNQTAEQDIMEQTVTDTKIGRASCRERV